MSKFAVLTAAVAAITSVAASAVALIDGLADKLAEAIGTGDMAQVEALAAELNAAKDSLAAAVAENTLVAEPEPEAETPVERAPEPDVA